MENVLRLEREFGEWMGYAPEQMVACSSGTAALHLALEAFRLPTGSEVIVPDFTMIACARAVTLAGLTPVFVDCDERLLMDGGLIPSARIGLNRKAVIMAVHIYGRRCDMNLLHSFTYEGDRGYVIEDLAEAHGVKPHPATDAACWSFYRNKIVAGEEGGMVAFRNPVHAALARQLRCLGFTAAHDFYHVPRGHNYRLADCLARLVLDDFYLVTSRPRPDYRREIEKWYDEACPVEWRMPPRDAVWVYDLRIPGLTRGAQDSVVLALNGAGIAARHGFKPMSAQAEYRGCRRVKRCGHSTCAEEGAADVAAREVLYLPVQPVKP